MTTTVQLPEELTTNYLNAIRTIGHQPRWSAPTATPHGHLHLHCPPGHTRRSIWTATPNQLAHANPGTPLDVELPGEPIGILTCPHATVALTRRNDDEHRDAVLLLTTNETATAHVIAHHISPFAAPTLTSDGRLALCPTGAPGIRRHLTRTTDTIHLIERSNSHTGIHHVHLHDNNEHTCIATPHETPWHTLPPGTTLFTSGGQLLAATTTTLTTIPEHPNAPTNQWATPPGRLLWVNPHPHDPETLLAATSSNGHITLHQLHPHTAATTLWKGNIGESLTSASLTQAGLWYVTATADHPTTLHHRPLNTTTGTISEDTNQPLQHARHTATAPDGTPIPYILTHRPQTPTPAHVLLTVYGGFGIENYPEPEPTVAAWCDRGGIVATAHVRGGGEEGPHWHEAGRGENKHHAISDLLAIAHHLRHNNIAAPRSITVCGASHGGFIALAAALSDNPETTPIAAVAVTAPLLDLVHLDRHANGAFWAHEFPTDPARRTELSPLHLVTSARTPLPPLWLASMGADARIADDTHTFIQRWRARGPVHWHHEPTSGHVGADLQTLDARAASMLAFAHHLTARSSPTEQAREDPDQTTP